MKILVVDDSKAMRMIVNRTLRQAGFGHHDIVEATNGQEALEAIVASPPDLVLTDWAMPIMNGLELVRTLRERGINVKVGFVTSKAPPRCWRRQRPRARCSCSRSHSPSRASRPRSTPS